MPHGRLSPRAAHVLLAGLPEATLRRLETYAKLLEKWQRVINLVGQSSLDDLWVRHFADLLQVSEAVPEARRWLDLGSGAGFPGLVTAIKYADDPEARVSISSRPTGANAPFCKLLFAKHRRPRSSTAADSKKSCPPSTSRSTQ